MFPSVQLDKLHGIMNPMQPSIHTIDVASTPWQTVYHRLTEIIQPRAIALVSTLDPQGNPNLAPFSFFTLISCNPPYLAFCPQLAGRTGQKKDTLRNIEQTGQFVVATVTETIAAQVNTCSTPLPYGESEFLLSGLTAIPAQLVKPGLVKESPVNMECEVVEIRHYGDQGGAGNLVVGKILLMHIDPSVQDETGRVLSEKLQAVGRMGGEEWCRTGDTFAFPRPDR